MTEANINRWAEKISASDPELSKKLNEDRGVGFDSVEKMNLPRYKKKKMKIQKFLDNPDEAVSNLESDEFFISLIPKKKLDRYSSYGINIKQAVDFVNNKIAPKIRDHYNIIITEYFENLYGGNIVIGEEKDQVYIEFKAGTQKAISRGTVIPEFYVTRDKFLDSFRYSFKDEKLREAIFKTLLSIPHEGRGRELKFSPGYYEFVIVKRDEKSQPEPIFLDYKSNPAFNIDWRANL